MYFKRLELVGFKSFYQKTTLNFEPGITAIVGPNGCGKSNIFDAIRWVLGEQSAKSLRGSDMQDVIFNGTDNKEPLSLAEVTVTFDNRKKFFSYEDDEVAITRRLFRSGESEYLLNKSPVRLKDILDILMDTGITAESYALIAQGKIDLILSARPDDRRLVFDEAAGITKYKSQKKETVRKLEETENNLLRVNDIIQEVKRQIGSLERQANKARRYKEAFEELKSREVSLGLLERAALVKEKDALAQQWKESELKEAGLLEDINQQEAKINKQREELKITESGLVDLRGQIMGLENLKEKHKGVIEFSQDRITELSRDEIRLKEQLEQAQVRLAKDEEKLSNFKAEQLREKQALAEKGAQLKANEEQLNSLNLTIRSSLEKITQAKKSILDITMKVSSAKNEVAQVSSLQQVCLSRQKRLQIEKAKVSEEKGAAEAAFNGISEELRKLSSQLEELNLNISGLKAKKAEEELSLAGIKAEIDRLEKEVLTLSSQKQFLDELRTKYDNITEAMEAVIQLDKLPAGNISGLVIKVRRLEAEARKAYGEAKPIELDTRKIDEIIARIEKEISLLKDSSCEKETHIKDILEATLKQEETLRTQEIASENKKTAREAVEEQLNRLTREEEIITLELNDTQTELNGLNEKYNSACSSLASIESEYQTLEQLIQSEQDNVASNGSLKERILVLVAETKTECEALTKRISSDEETLSILEGSFRQGKGMLEDIQRQIKENKEKNIQLQSEIEELKIQIRQCDEEIEKKNILLRETEELSRDILQGISNIATGVDAQRKELDLLKNSIYELQMRSKEIEFKLLNLKEKILQAYQADIDTLSLPEQAIEENLLREEIARLKDRVNSYGTVNLVAIEEYDELKKRYDFLTQQQNDLLSAKEALHQAILKINRTTKQMFLDTFEKIRAEFRNYFRLLFNGGDAQIFLVDEQDPLESGIEIICRPPGKKLQNVLLLSGGEKALSGIAMIFAIFRIKPSPFCILDEIDAALDEANVDRFSKILQEFAQQSQFIVITHNKKTIVNADVMYGITMEQSGVSKIVSVKFNKDKPREDTSEPEAVAEPV